MRLGIRLCLLHCVAGSLRDGIGTIALRLVDRPYICALYAGKSVVLFRILSLKYGMHVGSILFSQNPALLLRGVTPS
jgi:hypothetical protein